jgi:hypothetical protein
MNNTHLLLVQNLYEMVQGPCAHLQLHETSTVVLDRLNIIIDRLNVISSGSVVDMKTNGKILNFDLCDLQK